jgi:N-acyl-D-aspartate/D-glutamate deacylase
MNYLKNSFLLILIIYGCSSPAKYDVLIRNGQIIDGSGAPSFMGDVGINANTIVAIGDLKKARGRLEINAERLVVAPGFINMLSWSTESLILDGRSQSEIRQGVTLEAMGEGAVGVASALEYVPASFAESEELVALCKVASEYGGMYISHIRNEDNKLLQSIDELINVAKEANIRAEIYHFKQVGKSNWDKLDRAVSKIDSARSAGIQITADMYNYIASSTGFDIVMPDWVQEGGFNDWVARLSDPDRITDNATFEAPQTYSTAMVHVFVNGIQVIKDGEHTGAKPGRVVRGPWWKQK